MLQREEMCMGGGGFYLPLWISFELSQKKLELSLLLNFMLCSTLTKGNYRKSYGLFLWLLSQEGAEMRSAALSLCSHGENCLHCGTKVPLSAFLLELSAALYLFHCRSEYLPVSCFWTVDCKPDLPCQWVKQPKSSPYAELLAHLLLNWERPKHCMLELLQIFLQLRAQRLVLSKQEACWLG